MSERAMPEPLMWIVWCPKGHEFDYRYFADSIEAETFADELSQSNDDIGFIAEIEPLFSASQIEKKFSRALTLMSNFEKAKVFDARPEHNFAGLVRVSDLTANLPTTEDKTSE